MKKDIMEKYLTEASTKGKTAKQLIDELFSTPFMFKKPMHEFEKGVFFITEIDNENRIFVKRSGGKESLCNPNDIVAIK
jgi:hypothetical protein